MLFRSQNPTFARVKQQWNDPSLGLLAEMVPYHSNLWMLDDLIWGNDHNLTDKVLSLPRSRWGFWFHSLPHLATESQRQRNAGNTNHTIDTELDPAIVSWKPLGLLNIATTLLPMLFSEDIDLGKRILENTHALKFTSHDLSLIDLGMQKFGLDNTIGYVFRAATNTTLFPLKQANLAGAADRKSVV